MTLLARQYIETGRLCHLLLYPLVWGLPLLWASLLARLLGYAFAAWAIGRMVKRLNIAFVPATLAVCAFFLIDQSFEPSSEWIFRRAESKVKSPRTNGGSASASV